MTSNLGNAAHPIRSCNPNCCCPCHAVQRDMVLYGALERPMTNPSFGALIFTDYAPLIQPMLNEQVDIAVINPEVVRSWQPLFGFQPFHQIMQFLSANPNVITVTGTHKLNLTSAEYRARFNEMFRPAPQPSKKPAQPPSESPKKRGRPRKQVAPKRAHEEVEAPSVTIASMAGELGKRKIKKPRRFGQEEPVAEVLTAEVDLDSTVAAYIEID